MIQLKSAREIEIMAGADRPRVRHAPPLQGRTKAVRPRGWPQPVVPRPALSERLRR